MPPAPLDSAAAGPTPDSPDTARVTAPPTVITARPSAPRTEVAEEGEILAAQEWAPSSVGGIQVAPPPPSSRTVAEGPAWVPVEPGALSGGTPGVGLPPPLPQRSPPAQAASGPDDGWRAPEHPSAAESSPLASLPSLLPSPLPAPLAPPSANVTDTASGADAERARTAQTPPMQRPTGGGATRASIRALMVLGLACVIAIGAVIANDRGAFKGGGGPDAASYAARARAAAGRGHWDEPPGENFIALTEAALQRWPEDWTLAAVRRDAVGSLLAESRAAMPSDPSTAIARARMAWRIDPTDAEARKQVQLLSASASDAPEVIPTAAPSPAQAAPAAAAPAPPAKAAKPKKSQKKSQTKSQKKSQKKKTEPAAAPAPPKRKRPTEIIDIRPSEPEPRRTRPRPRPRDDAPAPEGAQWM